MDLTNKIIHGDAIEQLRIFPDNYFDSIVTDPPAGISFMGKKWDSDKGGRDHWIKWLSEVFIEAKRTLKPGGHALVWSLPRTSHWTGMALEDAGFEVRDIVHHIFGSGFPKSLDISKQIDKQAGVKREIVGQSDRGSGAQPNKLNNHGKGDTGIGYADGSGKLFDITTPSTPEAKQWSGWGTALKPAVGCWWLVRKPISERTVAENVLKWGVGGLNIDGCRVPFESTKDYENLVDNYKGGLERATPETKENWTLHGGGWKLGKGIEIPDETKGRFPANLIHDGSEEVLAQFPHSKSGAMTKPYKYTNNGFSLGKRTGETKQIHDSNEGSAARFFYCAKPSRAERDKGLEQLDTKEIANNTGNNHFIAPLGRETAYRNNHPTVKAQALMKYLIKMITPPGGIVLDMFAGSGSTCVAADDMGFGYIGIDQELDNCKIAEQRLKGKLKGNSSLDAYNNV
jgi:DNA modification methylase